MQRNPTPLLAVVGLLFISPMTSSADEEKTPKEKPAIKWHETIEEGWKESVKNQRPLLLFVTMDSCVSCEKMKNVTLADPEVASNVRKSFVAVYANANDIREFVKKVGVRVYPTTLLISPKARILDSIPGYVKADKLQVRLERASDRLKSGERAAIRDSAVTQKK